MLRTYLVVGAALSVSAMRFSTLKIKLEDGRDLELSARYCKAGVYFPVPPGFHCACITGIWGFYRKYCEKPVAIIGGRDYCFHFKAGANFSYVVPIGDTMYSLKPSLSHFKEKFQLLTKSYVERNDAANFEPCSSLLMVTGVNETSWTMRGSKGESVCLKSKGPNRYCRFNLIDSPVCSWETVRGISPGCADDASSVIFSKNCHRMVLTGRKVSGECSAIPGDDDETWVGNAAPSTVGSDNATASIVDNSTGAFEVTEANENSTEASTTVSVKIREVVTLLPISESTAPPLSTCTPPSRGDAAASKSATFWTPSEGACMHRYGWAELKNSLRRFSLRKLSELFPKEGKTMMEQVGEIMKIHGSLVERLCGKHLVSAELVAELAKWFVEILEEDLFGNTDRLDQDLFGRIKSSLKECVDEAGEIKFDEFSGSCGCNSIRDHVFLNGIKKPIHVPPQEAWVNYEILIESGWKMFTAAHAYCYSKFSRKNDHHSYSHHILQLFGKKIYDKWTQANNAANHELYSAILGSKCLITSLNNLDKCVAGIGHFSEISLWIDRGSATRRAKPFVRKKRETWKNQILQNREESSIWDKSGYCLQTPEDAGYKLGFGVCGD